MSKFLRGFDNSAKEVRRQPNDGRIARRERSECRPQGEAQEGPSESHPLLQFPICQSRRISFIHKADSPDGVGVACVTSGVALGLGDVMGVALGDGLGDGLGSGDSSGVALGLGSGVGDAIRAGFTEMRMTVEPVLPL